MGEVPTQPIFSSFHLWCLTDFTSSFHTIPLTLWGIRDWRSDFADVRTSGETPTQPHLAPFIFGVWLISLHPPTQPLSPCGVSVVGDLMLQLWDAKSLRTADLGSVRGRARAHLGSLEHPNRAALYLHNTSLRTAELDATRKHKCFLYSPFYGRACRWAMLGKFKPQGPEGCRRVA